MNRTLIGLYVLLWLCAAGRAWSQSAADPPEDAKPAPRAEAAPAAAVTGVYEEVEILRRLLNRELASAYGLPAHAILPFHFHTGQPASDVHVHHLAGAEGVYLKGCGVVYSASLPPSSLPLLPQAIPAAAAGPSAWDQARAELRGEKARPREQTTAARQTSLSETVLRLLAENGRHFRHLPDNEPITVALSFRGVVTCTHCHQTTAGMLTQVAVGKYRYVAAGTSSNVPQAGSPGGLDPNTLPQGMVVGELHLRQRRYDEAEKAYLGALQELSQALNREKEQHGAMEMKTLLASVEAANKLAQLYLSRGDNDKAVKYLEVARRAAQWAEERGGQGKGGPAAGVPLPARLVVSAPKKLLDQVGAGKMTFEEFRKAASVEYLTFPAADKAGPKTAPPAKP